MVLGALPRFSLRFVLPAVAAALFVLVGVPLRRPRATPPFGAALILSVTRRPIAPTGFVGLIVAATLRPAATCLRLRFR
jgi:hypothetical protein